MPELSFSDAEWKCLVKAQNSLEEEEEVALVKLLCLWKHKWLLQKCAGDFIMCDYKEIAELEDLECWEREESECLEKECKACEEQEELQRQCDCSVAKNHNISATWEDPSLSQMMASPSFWENLDFSVVGDIVSSSDDNYPSVQ